MADCGRNFLCVPLLFALLICVASARTEPAILLPSQLPHDSPIRLATDPSLYCQPVIGILTHLEAQVGQWRVLFTGGWAKKGLYYQTVEKIFKVQKVLEKNDAGDHFPIYAIDLGFELLAIIVSEDNDILETFTATNRGSVLQFVDKANIEGSVFQRFPPDLIKKLSTDCLAMHTNSVYVSTVRSQNYPVTAFQWHPEDAIRVTQHAANFLVSEARKSSNRPENQNVLDNLIYNYEPTYSGAAGKGYDEVVIFNKI